MPLPTIPFFSEIEDLHVTLNHISIDLANFIHPVSSVKECESPHTHMKAVYKDDSHKAMDVTIHLVICGRMPTDQRLLMTGKFSVSRDKPLTTGYVGVRLTQYCFDLIHRYIEGKPLADKNGKLFVMPEFEYREKHFENLAAG
jgi:hypothetical protein